MPNTSTMSSILCTPSGIGPDALVTGGVIAQLGAEGVPSAQDVDTRRFYNAPDISIFNDNIQSRRFLAINIGTGYRAHPLDTTNEDRFYSLRDPNVFNKLTQAQYDSFDIIKDGDLVEVSGSVGTVITANDRGWKFTLPDDQMVLANSTTFNNEVFFVAFSPDAAAAESCAAGRGRNFLYRVSVVNGDPIANLDNVVDETWFVTDMEQLMAEFKQVYAVRQQAYGTIPETTQTLVQVGALAMPELLVEIKCIAHL